MSNLGLVSIIVPAFRAESYISETVESVLQQTYQDWEMLIADDCSPDDTVKIVSAWATRDQRIRLIECGKNGGPAAARNAALKQSRGRWIAFLDSDDIWLPTKLQDSLAFALEHNAALVFTAFRRMSFDGSEVGRHIKVPRKVTYRQLLGNTVIATSTVLIDRDQTGDISMHHTYYDDFVCWLSILKRGFVGYGLNVDLMRYRIVRKSVSRNKLKSSKEVWNTYRAVEGLSMLASTWYFACYAFRGLLKYRKL
ncbi:glycosyltransferase family 2 protein [Eoetvoesiella caeni]